MKKIILTASVVLVLTPLIANAAWWNPIDWFSFIGGIFHPQPQIVEKIIYLPATTTSAVSSATITSDNNVSTATKKTTPAVKTPPVINNSAIIEAQAKAALKIKEEQDALIAKQKADEQAKIDAQKLVTTYCNGIKWNQCSPGLVFFCPNIAEEKGNAYCLTQDDIKVETQREEKIYSLDQTINRLASQQQICNDDLDSMIKEMIAHPVYEGSGAIAQSNQISKKRYECASYSTQIDSLQNQINVLMDSSPRNVAR